MSPEEQLLHSALACRSKSAHAHESHPEFAFDLLSLLLRQLNEHLVVMIRQRFLDRHRYHAAMMLRYMDLHETLGLIEERDYRTGREFKTLRKTIRMNRGVDVARDRLGLEKMPEIAVPSWGEFVGEQLGELVELGQLANGEPATGNQKSGGMERELQRLAKAGMVA